MSGADPAEGRAVDSDAAGGDEGGDVAGGDFGADVAGGDAAASGNRKLRSIVPLLLCRVSDPGIDFLGIALSALASSPKSSSGVGSMGFFDTAGGLAALVRATVGIDARFGAVLWALTPLAEGRDACDIDCGRCV